MTNSTVSFRPVFWWSLALGWMGLIFLFSAQSNFDFISEQWNSDPLSVAAHFSEYALLAALLAQALRHSRITATRAARLAFLLSVVYAGSDELHQAFVPGRHPDLRDVLVDALGALAGLCLLHWLLRKQMLAKIRQRG